MRPLSHLRRVLWPLALSPLVWACESSPSSQLGEADAGTVDVANVEAGRGEADASTPGIADADAREPSSDVARVPDAALEAEAGALETEREPNNATSEADLSALAAGAAVGGVIDPADDIDGFRVDLRAGELWTFRVEPHTADLAPHLAIFDLANSTPALVAVDESQTGSVVEQEQFVLESRSYVAVVRDRRNVPSDTSRHVGGPLFRYTLRSERRAFTPVDVALSTPASGTLRHPHAVSIFRFRASRDQETTFELRAARKSPPSSLDTRLSVVRESDGTWIGTNDDLSAQTTDSKLHASTLPAGSYLLIVDNVRAGARDLSFEVTVTSP